MGRRRRGRPGGAAAGAQGGQHLLATPATQQQQRERVGVQRAGHQVADRRGVLARVRPVRAGAARLQLARAWQQVGARAPHVVGHLGQQLTIQQGRGVADLGGDRVQDPVPLGGVQHPDPHPNLVGPDAAALDRRAHLPRPDRQLPDRAAAGVAAAAGQPVGVQPRPLLQRGHPGLPPPGQAEAATAPRPGGRPAILPRLVPHGVPWRLTSSASSASDSSVIHASPAPTTASARPRLDASSAAIRSSSVPSVTSRCTWTGRSCPIR